MTFDLAMGMHNIPDSKVRIFYIIFDLAVGMHSVPPQQGPNFYIVFYTHRSLLSFVYLHIFFVLFLILIVYKNDNNNRDRYLISVWGR